MIGKFRAAWYWGAITFILLVTVTTAIAVLRPGCESCAQQAPTQPEIGTVREVNPHCPQVTPGSTTGCYKVVQGDSFATISGRFYDEEQGYFNCLLEFNGRQYLTASENLQVGEVIKVENATTNLNLIFPCPGP